MEVNWRHLTIIYRKFKKQFMSTSPEFSSCLKETEKTSSVPGPGSTSNNEEKQAIIIDNARTLSEGTCDSENCREQQERESLIYQLRTALKNNDVDKLNELLQTMTDCKGDLELTGDTGLALLDGAANKGYAIVVRALLESGVNPDTPDHILYTPINNAAFNGHVDVVLALLESDKVNPNFCGKSQLTPINSAACNGHIHVVQAFLKCGKVNPNLPDRDGCTPINNAATNGYHDVVKVLLENEDVDPNFPDKYGRTPICNAAIKGHLLVVITLRNNKRVDHTLMDEDGLAPIDWARKIECEKIVDVLQNKKF
jgi:ankyrin repeat protein